MILNRGAPVVGLSSIKTAVRSSSNENGFVGAVRDEAASRDPTMRRQRPLGARCFGRKEPAVGVGGVPKVVGPLEGFDAFYAGGQALSRRQSRYSGGG
jgi:hypothetical protein